jgi:FKBP-type peptidyl-prolyl cis-trans isomerase
LGCATDGQPGYKEVADGVYMRLHALGDGTATAAEGDSILLNIRIAPRGAASGSSFKAQRTYAARDLLKGALAPVLARSHEGDSVGMVAPAVLFPWKMLSGATGPPVDGPLPMLAELRLLDIITPDEMRQRHPARSGDDALSAERRIISEWMASERAAGFQRWGTSMVFYRVERPPLTERTVRSGDRVRLDCQGSTLWGGEVVDDTRRHGGYYGWRYGDAGQVIPGLELAVQLFGHGGGGDILLPAEYAFGADGVDGSVPPQCPLLYQVRSVTILPGDQR